MLLFHRGYLVMRRERCAVQNTRITLMRFLPKQVGLIRSMQGKFGCVTFKNAA